MALAPLAPLVLYAGAAAVVLGLDALIGLRGNSLVVAPVSLALLGLVQAGRRWEVRAIVAELSERRLPGATPLTEPGSVLYARSTFDERLRDTDTSAVLGAILHHLEVRP
jgi:hypothetical protein